MTGTPQDSTFVTYATKLTKDMEKLEDTFSCEEADRKNKSINPWPGVSIYLDVGNGKSERIKIIKAEPLPQLKSPIGRLSLNAGQCVYGLQNGSLRILTLQPEGKKEMNVTDFINGCKGEEFNYE